jgi:hypothetical protein
MLIGFRAGFESAGRIYADARFKAINVSQEAPTLA